MTRYKAEDLRRGLERIGLLQGDLLNVHSSLFNFGVPEDIQLARVPEMTYEVLTEIIGNEGTISVPAFNFDFCRGVPFNRQTTPPALMGKFTDFVFSLKFAHRSSHPMQSVLATGKHAAWITKNDTLSSFEENGAWDTMVKLNAKVLLLGASFQGTALFHLIEEREKVPYRFWKSFTGSYIDQGIESERTYNMYVRYLDHPPLLDLSSLEQLLSKNSSLSSFPVGAGRIICFRASDYISIATEKIRNNPYYFVSNHPDYLKD